MCKDKKTFKNCSENVCRSKAHGIKYYLSLIATLIFMFLIMIYGNIDTAYAGVLDEYDPSDMYDRTSSTDHIWRKNGSIVWADRGAVGSSSGLCYATIGFRIHFIKCESIDPTTGTGTGSFETLRASGSTEDIYIDVARPNSALSTPNMKINGGVDFQVEYKQEITGGYDYELSAITEDKLRELFSAKYGSRFARAFQPNFKVYYEVDSIMTFHCGGVSYTCTSVVDNGNGTITVTDIPGDGYNAAYYTALSMATAYNRKAGFEAMWIKDDGTTSINGDFNKPVTCKNEGKYLNLVLNPEGGKTWDGKSSDYNVRTTATVTLEGALQYGSGNYYGIGVHNPVREGYKFLGWYLKDSAGNYTTKIYDSSGICVPGTSYWNEDNIYINFGNLVVYAKWEKNEHTLTIDPNGGQMLNFSSNWTSGTVSKTFIYGQPVIFSLYYDDADGYVSSEVNKYVSIPVRENYEFTGWVAYKASDTSSSAGSVTSEEYPWSSQYSCHIYDGSYNGDVVIKATWKELPYTVKFDLNNGTGHKDYSYEDKSVSVASYFSIGDPTRTGYNFVGWQITTATGTGGWRTDTSVQYISGSDIGIYNKYVKDNEWQSFIDNTSKDFVTLKALSDGNGTVTLKAMWTPKEYNLIIDPNGGQMLNFSGNWTSVTVKKTFLYSNATRFCVYNREKPTENYVYSDSLLCVSRPKRTGWSFNGWKAYSTSKMAIGDYSSAGKISSGEPITSNTCVYSYDGTNLGDVTIQALWKDDIKPTAGITISNSNWTNKDVTVTATGTDLGSGIKYVYIEKQNTDGTWSVVATGTEKATSVTYTQKSEGVCNYRAYSVDIAGNTSDRTGTVTAKVDKTAPVLSPTVSSSKWINKDVTVSASATDNASSVCNSGIKNKSLTIARGTKVETTSADTATTVSYTDTTEGSENFTITVYDNAGNSTTKTIATYIDKTKPTISNVSDAYGWTNKDVSVAALFGDKGGSYLKDYKVVRNSDKSTVYNGSFAASINSDNKTFGFSAEQNQSYTITLTDNAGNSVTKTFSVRIDKTKITSDIKASYGWYTADKTLTFNFEDKNVSSAISSIEFKDLDENVSLLDKATISKASATKWSLEYEFTNEVCNNFF